MGTAGHVDHGKTALVRALTGIECDTHREEKTRGITINLGFAHTTLSNGDTVGIVDVPGHKDFVNTMVSGASGIDFTLMVVAADEGVMPQTREHLSILQLLGVNKGCIAVTKVDLVDREVRDMVKEEIQELLDGTELSSAPVLEVSSVTGEGLTELLAALERVASEVESRSRGEVFRMFIDRIFTVKGFGTVVTGSARNGVLRAESEAFLEPGGRALRVRRLERYGKPVDEIAAGDRGSINLVGLDRADFRRGMVITDRPLRSTTLLDCSLRLFPTSRPLGLWSHVWFLLGTFEAQVKVHLMDRDRLPGGESALVQIHLPAPLVAQSGDHFVIRNTSGDITLGGGEVIDAAPLHHRRRKPEVVRTMERIAEGKLPELIAQELRKQITAVSARDLANRLNVSTKDVEREVRQSATKEIHAVGSGPEMLMIDAERYGKLARGVLRRIDTFHRRFPLQPGGPSLEELISALGLETTESNRRFLQHLIECLVDEGAVKRVEHTWARAEHEVRLDPLLQKQASFVEQLLQRFGMQVPIMAEVQKQSSTEGIDERRLQQILSYLRRSKKAFQSDGVFLHADIVDPIREKLVCALAKQPNGLTVAQFRDLIGGNRKICLVLYALFDSEGITTRVGDVRRLTKKGEEIATGFRCESN